MNTPIPRLTTISQLTLPVARAQLSPLRRRSMPDALKGSRIARLVRNSSHVSTNPAPIASATSVLTARWWDPHLLDRLQAPLTRYRE